VNAPALPMVLPLALVAVILLLAGGWRWEARRRRSGDRVELERYRSTFASSNGRGGLAELALTQTAIAAGLRENVHFTTQTEISGSSSARADLVLLLDGERRLLVDAKCVVQPYWTARDARDPRDQSRAFKDLTQKIRRHATDLASRRYDRPKGSHGGVVLFVPDDDIAVAALDYDPGLQQFLISNAIYLVGPTGFALLAAATHAVGSEREIAADLENLASTLTDTIDELADAVTSFDLTGKHLHNAAKSHTKTHAHLGKAVRYLNEVRGLTGRGTIMPQPKPVTATQMVLAAAHEDSGDDRLTSG